MTLEARIAFIVFFFAVWLFAGLLAWAAVAVLRRGRGALLALPLGLGAAAAAGVLVPVLGARDPAGFFASVVTATAGGILGSLAGVRFAERMHLTEPPHDGSLAPAREHPDRETDA